jgi:5-methylcytosine-specific restriction protein A
VITTQYDRNQWVSEMAQRRAQGICQLCSCPAPFKKRDGTPYLETHHVIWLSQGRDDTLENTVALCPNCHRKMHILSLEADIDKLIIAASKNHLPV